MTTGTETPPLSAARTLSESEIQNRLYGPYFGKKKAAAQPPVQAQTRSSPSADSAWTGSEILTGELRRLRSELISLRQEKERLAVRLEQASQPAPAKVGPGVGGWIGKIFGFFLLLGTFGYLSGAALQASPSRSDFTPYTVQVAVYNGLLQADHARKLLQELGYPAFLVELPRANGASQYRVYVGSFVTKEEAARESKRLETDTRFRDFKDAFVLIR
jgi:hypothetical protein